MAVDYIHSRHIIDLKSNNVFVTANNIIKLGDFGIASLGSNLGTSENRDRHANYMSPEVCESKLTVTRVICGHWVVFFINVYTKACFRFHKSFGSCISSFKESILRSIPSRRVSFLLGFITNITHFQHLPQVQYELPLGDRLLSVNPEHRPIYEMVYLEFPLLRLRNKC